MFPTLEDQGRLLPGYGWVFPMGDDELNVGAYLVRRPGGSGEIPPRIVLQQFAAELGRGDAPAGPVPSAPIPMGITSVSNGVTGCPSR